ncbi:MULTISPECIES: hypothetical protein [Bacteria]|uniref:hypothetical protein n=1 Tax=Bacteria TaxID=2 RepID=UPI001FAEABF6|nr:MULTISPECIES: hypothetical protein [Bacteria]
MILAMLLGAAQAAAPQRLLDCTQIGQAAMTSREEGLPEPGRATDVQLLATHSLCGGWAIIDMWRSGYGPSATWRARRKVMDRFGRLTVSTTEAVDCPVLMAVLTNLNDVPISPSVIPRRNKADRFPPPITLDGTWFTLHIPSSEQSDRSRANVTISGNDGPVAHWAEASMKQLEPCWRPAA